MIMSREGGRVKEKSEVSIWVGMIKPYLGMEENDDKANKQ